MEKLSAGGKIVAGAVLISLAGVAFVNYLGARRYADVEAVVTRVGELCYVQFERDHDTLLTGLRPCEREDAIKAAFGQNAEQHRGGIIELQYHAPSDGRMVTAPVAEAMISSSPVQPGQVLNVKVDIDHAGFIKGR